MNEVYLLTGSNIGNRLQNLTLAAAALEAILGKALKVSAIYETAAWGKEDQAPFLNQVLCFQTDRQPAILLERILETEISMGRKREMRYGPRKIDIDILLYGDQQINRPGLTIPHPRMQDRRFVLTPLADIAPALQHPVLKKTIGQLLKECPDPLPVNKFS